MKLGRIKQRFLINTITDALDAVAVLIGGSVHANHAKNKEEALADLIDDLKTLLFEINNAEVNR